MGDSRAVEGRVLGVPIAFHCVPIAFHCVPIAFHCVPIAFHCVPIIVTRYGPGGIIIRVLYGVLAFYINTDQIRRDIRYLFPDLILATIRLRQAARGCRGSGSLAPEVKFCCP